MAIKFDRLLERIKCSTERELDLTDFGVGDQQVEDLVTALNANSNIKTLILKQNNLGNESLEPLKKLKNIMSLDISHNNFAEDGIISLNAALKELRGDIFRLHANHNVQANSSIGKALVFSSLPDVAAPIEASIEVNKVDPVVQAIEEIIADKLKSFSLEKQKEIRSVLADRISHNSAGSLLLKAS